MAFIFNGPLGPIISTPPYLVTMACKDIAFQIPGLETQIAPRDLANRDFETAQGHYWSSTQTDLVPACAVFPTSSQDVSGIVKVLNQYPDVGFAVKSGSHNPNTGFSSTKGGVLISFSKISTTTISDDGSTADIPPGARWEKVIADLEPRGVAVVSGRIGLLHYRRHALRR
jgi:FAD/FMN-containing dehydrogenase